MLPIPYDIDPTLYLPVAAFVATLVLLRLYAGDRAFGMGTAPLWHVLRITLWPFFDRLFARLPFGYAKTTVGQNEHVATVDTDLQSLQDALRQADYEKQPLASIARDWHGDMERGSYARYTGPKPPRLPDWLRRYQVHVRPFGPDGEIRITAHHEYNAWVPWWAPAHLLAIGLDAELGAQYVRADLADFLAENEI